jgi:hypothetical protein
MQRHPKRAAKSAAGILALVGAATWLVPAASAQDRSSARLEYTVPTAGSCPDEQSFRDIVAGRLGYDPFEDGAALTIEAAIAREETGFTGRVRAVRTDGSVAGQRTIDAPEQDCREMAASMAIAISTSNGSSRATKP